MGEKFSLWEGGVRVPAIVRWPEVIQAGQISNQLAITMTGVPQSSLLRKQKADPAYSARWYGLLRYIRSPEHAKLHAIFSEKLEPIGRAKGHWKYLDDGTDQYLFDLSVDQRERANFRSRTGDLRAIAKRFQAMGIDYASATPARIMVGWATTPTKSQGRCLTDESRIRATCYCILVLISRIRTLRYQTVSPWNCKAM
jgi:arylsulfatase A-like enzyme